MNDLDEIEKINQRMALGITKDVKKTINIASLEEKSIETQIKRDMPSVFTMQDQASLNTKNTSIDISKPLSN